MRHINDLEIQSKSLKKLVDSDPERRVEVVNRKICLQMQKGKYKINDIEIEIMQGLKFGETKRGTPGYEVYARAWKDGKQFGFGDDGSIEIERFRNYGFTSFLVEDPNGDISITYSPPPNMPEKLPVTVKYREDLATVFLRDLAHTIGIVGKLDTKITIGKRGSTVDTFNPRRVASTRVGTGYFAFNASGNFATWRASASPTTGDITNGSGDPDYSYIQMEARGGGTFGWNVKTWGNFDTSALPDTDTISSAVLSIHPNSAVFAPTDTIGSATIGITGFTPANSSSLVLADMNTWGSTRFATDITFNTMSTSAYTDFTLNASGIAAISKTGYSLFMYRLGWDIDNSSPGTPANGLYTGSSFDFGTTNPQKLVVTHSASSSTNYKANTIAF